MDITVVRSQVNHIALNGALRAALPELVNGISTRFGNVIVHLADDASAADVTKATMIVQNHDHTVLTTEQQTEADQQAALTQSRTDNADLVDSSKYTISDPAITELFKRIEWLEREIRDMRRL